MEKIRIQKLLADAGYCSRRQAEKLISDGKVKVNGHPVKLGDKATLADLITVGGERVYLPRKKQYRYLMLYKPRGYVTTTSDELNRRCVMDLLEDVEERVYPVGRLDKDSEGLLLLTNEGGLAHELLSPKKHVDKEYYVRVAGRLTEADSAAFAAGLHLDDGLVCQPAELRVMTSGEESEAYVILREGKFHQIKRMLAYLGKPVLYLERVRMGNLLLDPVLERGAYRLLTKEEWQALAKLTEETGKPRNFNKKESDFLLKKEKTSCNPTK